MVWYSTLRQYCLILPRDRCKCTPKNMSVSYDTPHGLHTFAPKTCQNMSVSTDTPHGLSTCMTYHWNKSQYHLILPTSGFSSKRPVNIIQYLGEYQVLSNKRFTEGSIKWYSFITSAKARQIHLLWSILKPLSRPVKWFCGRNVQHVRWLRPYRDKVAWKKQIGQVIELLWVVHREL